MAVPSHTKGKFFAYAMEIAGGTRRRASIAVSGTNNRNVICFSIGHVISRGLLVVAYAIAKKPHIITIHHYVASVYV